MNIGNGVITSFTINHGLGTKDVVVACYSNSTLALVTPSSVTIVDENRVRLAFLLAVSLNGNRVVIVG